MTQVNKTLIKTPEEIELEEVSVVKRRYNSLVEATLNLEKVNRELQTHIDLQNQKLITAQQNVDINKQIVINSIQDQNATKEEFVTEINLLKGKLKAITDCAK